VIFSDTAAASGPGPIVFLKGDQLCINTMGGSFDGVK